jgi:hypothetical protein
LFASDKPLSSTVLTPASLTPIIPITYILGLELYSPPGPDRRQMKTPIGKSYT